MKSDIHSTRYDRILKALMIKHECSKKEALFKLKSLTIKIECREAIRYSLPLQAALLTAVNTAKRAFAGGLILDVPEEIDLKLPLKQFSTLNEAINTIAGPCIVPESKDTTESFKLLFGKSAHSYNELEVICNGWQGGVVTKTDDITLEGKNTSLPIGGIYAGALGVACAFYVTLQLNIKAADKSRGLSLWNYDKSQQWHSNSNSGPEIKVLPSALWLMGLGHIGQAHAWTLSLLPYSKCKPTIYLLDYDILEDVNLGSGLVSFQEQIGSTKTSVTADWLTVNKFNCRIVDRPFTKDMQINAEEPYNEPKIALTGFDDIIPRRALGNAGFDGIIDCGIGGELHSFDSIAIRIFPNQTATPEESWSKNENSDSKKEYDCGNFAELAEFEMEDQAISTSFVGVITSSIAFSELIKAIHNVGSKYSITYKIRSNRIKLLTDNSISENFINHYQEVG